MKAVRCAKEKSGKTLRKNPRDSQGEPAKERARGELLVHSTNASIR
jgi:hypothetical protein